MSLAEPRRSPAEHLRTVTADGVAIAYTWWRRPSNELIVLAPGFWRIRMARENLFLATHFFRRGYDVATLDFRGHGDSGGAYSFGASEALDLHAVLERLVGPERPYSRFSLIGLSLGGSIAVDALARLPSLPCRALALISSPADLLAVRPRPWRTGATRQMSWRNALRVPRMNARGFFARKPAAAEAIAELRMPKLIVTAEGDWLVDPAHGRLLARSAAPPVDYVHWKLPGSLHADALVRRVPLRVLRLLDRWFYEHSPP